MSNATNEASLISSEINIIRSDDKRGYCGTSSSWNTSTTKAANFSKLLLQDFHFVEESFEAVKLKASQVIAEVHEARHKFEKLMLLPEGTEGRDTGLVELKKKVSKLKSDIPFNLIAPAEIPNPHVNWRPRPNPQSTTEISLLDLINRKMERSVLSSGISQEVESSVTNGLGYFGMRCLLAFLEFPPNAIIKRSILFAWVSTSMITNTYDYVHGLEQFDLEMDDIIAKGNIIEAVQKKSSLTVAGYRMNPSVHYTLSHRRIRDGMCLAHSIEREDNDIFYTGSSGQFPEDEYLDILHLGKWKKSSTQHIEFIDTLDLFFKNVSNLRKLNYISLRGISMVVELPKFITELGGLKILDLQACYNLEVIPPNIANLRHTLTRLDMSECYFLEHMPKAIATLDRLQVLKGFFVGELEDEKTCTLQDLESLQELVKLNIYTNMKEFPKRSQLIALENLQRLRNLTISWGGCSVLDGTWKSRPTKEHHPAVRRKLARQDTLTSMREGPYLKRMNAFKMSEASYDSCSFNLEKLDLQCVPKRVTSGWLMSAKFEELKRLYIRGGQFTDLGQLFEGRHWYVKILRLKHLNKLELDWDELHHLFPQLICLENVNCPKLDGFPCDDDGVWMKNVQQDPTTSL